MVGSFIIRYSRNQNKTWQTNKGRKRLAEAFRVGGQKGTLK